MIYFSTKVKKKFFTISEKFVWVFFFPYFWHYEFSKRGLSGKEVDKHQSLFLKITAKIICCIEVLILHLTQFKKRTKHRFYIQLKKYDSKLHKQPLRVCQFSYHFCHIFLTLYGIQCAMIYLFPLNSRISIFVSKYTRF